MVRDRRTGGGDTFVLQEVGGGTSFGPFVCVFTLQTNGGGRGGERGKPSLMNRRPRITDKLNEHLNQYILFLVLPPGRAFSIKSHDPDYRGANHERTEQSTSCSFTRRLTATISALHVPMGYAEKIQIQQDTTPHNTDKHKGTEVLFVRSGQRDAYNRRVPTHLSRSTNVETFLQ